MKQRRLTGPSVLFETTAMGLAEATDRLREALTERPSIELDRTIRSRRRLAGEVIGDHVRLRVDDANFITARKSWNVEFSGRLEGTEDGAALTGVIDIPDRRALGRLIVLFQLIAVVLGLIAIAVAPRAIAESGGLSLPAAAQVLIPLVVVAGLVLGPAYVRREGELAAGEDAALLAQAVSRTLNPGVPARVQHSATRRVAIRRLSSAVVTLENDGDKFTVEGSWAWSDLVKAALGAALVGRAACIVEDKHGGRWLTRELQSSPSSRWAQSKSMSTICFESMRVEEVDAFVDAPEFEARWVWMVVTADPATALEATEGIARAGDSIDLNQLPTTAQAMMSMFDATEIWWLNAPPEAETILADVASRSGWVVVAHHEESAAE